MSADHCYKVYFLVSGSAAVEMDDGRHALAPGRAYFISGYRLRRNVCAGSMEVFWMHFVPESLLLRHHLELLPPFRGWSLRAGDWLEEGRRELCRRFAGPAAVARGLPAERSPAGDCRMQAFLLGMLARLLESLDEGAAERLWPDYGALKPALDFMQEHSRSNPPLAEIAARVHLAPNHFHRRFRRLFGITPFNHMLVQRINRARHLLADTSLTVKEVAAEAGYDNPLYFSRVFTRQTRVTPSAYRVGCRHAGP